MEHPSGREERRAGTDTIVERRMNQERWIGNDHRNWTDQAGRYRKTRVFDCQCPRCRGQLHIGVRRLLAATGECG